MTEAEAVTVQTESYPLADHAPLLILAAAILIALLAFLLGLRRLRQRRRAEEDKHLVVDIAEPETLQDRERKGRGPSHR